MSSNTPLPTAAAPTATANPQVSAPAFRNFLNNVKENIRNCLSDRRPWSELTDRTTFSKPESISDAATRLRKNYAYFRVNYLSLMALTIAVSLVTHPFSLLLLSSLLAAWLFLYLFRPADQPLVLFGRTFTDREMLGILVLCSIVVVFLTSVGSVLISALMIGAAVVCAHGSYRVPEDLFLDENESLNPSTGAGFFSFLGNAASNAAAAVAPVIAARA